MLTILFYWHYVLITASLGGSVYATGDWRLPLGYEDFGSEVAVRWVIAGTDSLSSCYAWTLPDEGYHFEGFYDAADDSPAQVAPLHNLADLPASTDLVGDMASARLWSVTDTAKTDDGIISAANYYPAQAVRHYVARFAPDDPGAATDMPAVSIDEKNRSVELTECAYDLSGRRVNTSATGYIVIRGCRPSLIVR